MRALLTVLPALIAIGAAPLPAIPGVVTSPAPATVALTVYRSPYGRGAMNLGYLQGFALVTETRRIAVPKGASTLRFEGVVDASKISRPVVNKSDHSRLQEPLGAGHTLNAGVQTAGEIHRFGEAFEGSLRHVVPIPAVKNIQMQVAGCVIDKGAHKLLHKGKGKRAHGGDPLRRPEI
jgi:hypothetical protein